MSRALLSLLALAALAEAAVRTDMPFSSAFRPISPQERVARRPNVEYLETIRKASSSSSSSSAAAASSSAASSSSASTSSSAPAAAAPSDPWNTTGIKGLNYVPSNAPNSIYTWVNFNASLVTQELGYAKLATANTIRVALSWLAWNYAPSAFLANVSSFLTIASSMGMKTILAVFDGTGCCDATPSWITSGQYLSTGWIANPGPAMVNNASAFSTLDPYVAALTSAFGSDPRVAGWDVMYQPILELPSQGGYYDFLTHYSQKIIGAVDASKSFTTISIIPGGESCDAQRVPTQYVNVLSFENYNGNLGAIGGDTLGVQGCASSLAPQHGGVTPPVVLSGTMSRNSNPPQGLCDCLFEASGQGWIDIPTHPKIGVIITSLMIGVDGESWGTIPDRGLVYPNGTWYDPVELGCMQAPVPNPPPAPPGPPPTIVNFTAGGLNVGLRRVSRAIQLLGIYNDTRWFRNFSFVPPLWDFIPPQPHRDFPGAHHIGDIILRVQPASETNMSSWAFYSSAQGAENVAATPLNSTNPDVYDASDLTPILNQAGAVDSRYTLGLNVTRYYEMVGAGGSDGFRLRFVVTNSNASAVRIGSLAFPFLSNSNFGQMNLTQIIAFGSFHEGYPGGQHSFATITRVDGSDTLIAYSCDPSDGLGTGVTPMEAWRPLLEDGSNTAQGVYAWEVVSGAYEAEWNANMQAPSYLTFPNDPLHAAAWPNPKSPTPSWHLAETMYVPNPRQWNPPTTITLQPGESQSFAVCFALALPPTGRDAEKEEGNSAPAATLAHARAKVAAQLYQSSVDNPSIPTPRGPRARDVALAQAGAPVVFPVPGYVLGNDMTGAILAVLPPAGASLASATSDDPATLAIGPLSPAPNPSAGEMNMTIVSLLPGTVRGRARVVLHYSDGTTQSVNYYVLNTTLRQHISNYGQHASTVAWLPRDFADPFGRSASVMPWDREDGIHLLQDGRPFIVGLSDDAGGGANLGLASRVLQAPTVLQASRLDDYVYWTLQGTKNDTTLPPLFSLQDMTNNRIRMTIFYYAQPQLNASGYYQELDKCELSPSWCSFNQDPQNGNTDWLAEYRQFNFPHQISVYLALYRVARDWDGVASAAGLRHSWDWYLTWAALTTVTVACPDVNTGNLDCIPTVGLMDGTVFREVLFALQEEDAAGSPSPGPYTWGQWASNITALMSARVFGKGEDDPAAWNNADAPFGSEFSFDTTGQEEVVTWGTFFNATSPSRGDLASRVVECILAYTPSQPIWALHGSAYGMGDFSNNAKWMVTGGWEREGGHYRAGLNSFPLAERFRVHPDDLYLLHVGLAGATAVLPNVDGNGAPSMSFHTYPFVMQHDPNSGDWGLAFFGHTMGTGSYLVNHTALGWLCFLCDVTPHAAPSATTVTFVPRDTFHTRVYIEPLGLQLRAWTGAIANVTLDFAAKTITVAFEAPGSPVPAWNNELKIAAPRETEYVLARPFESGEGAAPPYSNFRLEVSAMSAEREFSFNWVSPTGAQLVRNAWQWPVASPSVGGIAVISWT